MKKVYRLAYDWLEKWLDLMDQCKDYDLYWRQMALTVFKLDETTARLSEIEKRLYFDIIEANISYLEKIYKSIYASKNT